MSADASPPPGERYLFDLLRQDMQAGFQGVNSRLDRVVTSELFAAFQTALDRRIGDIEQDVTALQARREAAESERRVDMRWRIGLAIGVAAPILWGLFETSRGVVS